MKPLKEVAWIIAGGITGAVALIGISVVLVVAVGVIVPIVPYVGHIIERWAQKWTLEEVYTIFAATGSTGFILGAYAGKRYSHIIRKWFSAAVIGGIPMIFCLWLLYGYASHVEIPRVIKLADCTNSIVKVHLKTPNGRYFNIEVTAPSNSPDTLLGNIHISDGASTSIDFPIGSDHVKDQFNFFHAQRDYDLEITFDRPPPSSTSVCLHWLQAYTDRDRSGQTR